VSGAPIDRAAFEALVAVTGGEMDFVDELVDTYLADGREQVAALRAAVAAGGGPDDLVRPAHSLKSGSLNVGALELGELCRVLEEEARGGVPHGVADQVERIASAFDAVGSALLDERASRTGGG